MKKMFFTLIITIFLLAGCTGEQRGLYVVSSHELTRLEPTLSEIVAVRGSENVPEALDRERLLFAVIAYSPGLVSYSSTSQSEDGTYVSTMSQEHLGPTGSFCYHVNWDRTDESVVIGNQEFLRANGNVFLVMDGGGTEHEIYQIPEMIDAASIEGILDSARANVPKGSAAAKALEVVRLPAPKGKPSDGP